MRELETLQARYRELAKDAREAVWRGDAATAAPAHDPELVVSRDVLKKAREARQASVAAALRVQSLPPISDVVATQVRPRPLLLLPTAAALHNPKLIFARHRNGEEPVGRCVPSPRFVA